MAKRSQKTQNKSRELVVITFTEDIEQAKDYEAVLRSNHIPVVIRKQADESTNAKGFAVMVPEEFVDEAHVVIESQNAYDDFYDFTSEEEYEDEDEDDDNYDGDFSEDNF